MKINYPGVLPGSQIYAHIPGAGADQLCFYPTLLGEYRCSGEYQTERKSFDSFLLIYVVSGSGYARSDTAGFSLAAGDILLLDCYQPHAYGTTTGWEIQWLHFDGPMARAYYQRAVQNGQRIRIASHYPAMHNLRKLLDLFRRRKGTQEIQLSRLITDLLTDLMLYSSQRHSSARETASIDESIRFISDNLDREISVEQLAAHAALSPFYFSRLFKEQTGLTPHRYVVMVRLDYSRYILRTTEDTIKEVAYQCGFRSESNFCTRFREAFGISPMEFRRSI